MSVLSTAAGAVKNWWWFIIKGLLFLAAGVAILMRPLEGYVGLSLLFSIVILAVGITQVAFSVSNRGHMKGWGWTLASGILDIAIGAYLYMYPLVTMATLPYFVGFWLLIRAFYLMGFAMDLGDSKVSGWGWMLTGGILVAIAAFLVLYYPAAGAVSIVAASGAGFLVGGVVNIFLAFKLKDVHQKVQALA